MRGRSCIGAQGFGRLSAGGHERGRQANRMPSVTSESAKAKPITSGDGEALTGMFC